MNVIESLFVHADQAGVSEADERPARFGRINIR
jgi:hypothetical protein